MLTNVYVVNHTFVNLQTVIDGLINNPEIYLLSDLNLNYNDSKSCTSMKIKKFESHSHFRQLIDWNYYLFLLVTH